MTKLSTEAVTCNLLMFLIFIGTCEPAHSVYFLISTVTGCAYIYINLNLSLVLNFIWFLNNKYYMNTRLVDKFDS